MGFAFLSQLALMSATMFAISGLVLYRLPNLFVNGETKNDRNIAFYRGITLCIPALIFTFSDLKGGQVTESLSLPNSAKTIPGNFYALLIDNRPNFAQVVIESEERSYRRQELTLSMPLAAHGGRRIILIEVPVNRFGRTLSGATPEESYKKGRSSVADPVHIKKRFENAMEGNILVVKRIDSPQHGFSTSIHSSSDIYFMWNVEKPEETHSGTGALSVLFYLFPYCLLFVFAPFLFANEDARKVEVLLKNRSILARLFFSRKNIASLAQKS